MERVHHRDLCQTVAYTLSIESGGWVLWVKLWGSDPRGRAECLDLSPEGFFRGAGCRKGIGQKVTSGEQTCRPLPSVPAEGVVANILGGRSVKTADSM